MSNSSSGITPIYSPKSSPMPGITLYDGRGTRKYLTPKERRAFASAALHSAPPIRTFCLTLIYTGARISEVLALTPERIDRANSAIIFETLKRRRRGVFRAIPVPPALAARLAGTASTESRRSLVEGELPRIWNWGRTTAWKHVKSVMEVAGIQKSLATPKAAR